MSEGYKNTSLGDIPKSWELIELGEILNVNTGNKNAQDSVDNGKYPFFTRSVATQRIDDFSYDTEALLIAGEGIFKVKHFSGKFDVHQRTYILTSKDEKSINLIFFQNQIQSRIEKLVSTSVGSTVQSLRKPIIQNLQLVSPPLPEQQKIAEILSTVDEKIEAIDQRIAETQELKKGLMQQLLTKGIGHTQFKDSPLGEIPESWEVKEFGAICEITSSKRIHRSDYIDEGIPFFRGKEITQLSKGEMLSDLVYISEDKFNVLKYKFGAPIEGDILITSVGTIGSIYLVKENDEFYFKDGNLIWLRNIDAELNRNFLAQYLNSVIFQGLISNISSGSSQKALTIVKLKGLPLAIPPKNEQLKIAEILNKVKEKLQIQQDKKAEYQELKKGLMQQLLTGKIRVKTT